MRLKPDQRHLIGEAVDRGVKKGSVATVLGVTLKTVNKWNKRRKHLNDRIRQKSKKITDEIRQFVRGIRITFEWGTARIRQALMEDLPDFMVEKLEEVGIIKPEKIKLSRPTINSILQEFKLNGYKRKDEKAWKFFRASKPNELWQLDPKGPVTIQGQKYWWVMCIDDFSRYIVMLEQLDHDPTALEIAKLLEPHIKKYRPKNILTDNKPFADTWDEWCEKKKVKPLHAHLYYPQDKGKVERNIRNLKEEFTNLAQKFPELLKGKITEYQKWFNTKRYHLGVNAKPVELFQLEVNKFT